MGLIEEICRLFPDATPDQVVEQLNKIDPRKMRLHRLTRSED